MTSAPEPARTPLLRAAPPTGPGWVHATIAQRTYRHRLGWAQYDLALLAEDHIYILRRGWKFIGARPQEPLCQLVAEGWIPRPHGLPSRAASPPAPTTRA
jgi:hypothetical protein